MSKPEITLQDIERIAELAALELSAEEKQRLVAEFGAILGYFRTIDAAPVGELHDHPVDAADHLRDDEVRPSGLRPDAFSPHMENGHFKVPKVIE